MSFHAWPLASSFSKLQPNLKERKVICQRRKNRNLPAANAGNLFPKRKSQAVGCALRTLHRGHKIRGFLYPLNCSLAAQAFQPVPAQAKAWGYLYCLSFASATPKTSRTLLGEGVLRRRILEAVSGTRPYLPAPAPDRISGSLPLQGLLSCSIIPTIFPKITTLVQASVRAHFSSKKTKITPFWSSKARLMRDTMTLRPSGPGEPTLITISSGWG